MSNSEATSPSPDLEAGTTSKKFLEKDAGDGTTRQDQILKGFPLALCLSSIYSCLFLVALDQTIVVTLFTEVGNKFNSFNKIAWLVTGFLLPTVVLAAVWGKLSIIFGRKIAMLVGIALFEAGSLMCALSQNMDTLIGGRVLAGIGAGSIASLSFIITSEVLSIDKRAMGFALFGITFGAASVIGPLIGGAFTENVSWRWCFYINLPIGGLATFLFCVAFRPPLPQFDLRQKLKMIDYVGIVLLTIGMVLLLLGLTFPSDGSYAWNSAAVIACLVLGTVFTVAYGVWNYKFTENPLLPWEMVKIPQLFAAGVAMAGMYGYFMAAILYLSVYFQNIHGLTSLHAGLSLLPFIISTVAFSVGCGIFLNRFKVIKPITMIGAILAPIGCGTLCLLDVDSKPPQRIGYLILGGVATGCYMQSLSMCSQVSAPKIPGGTILATTWLVFMRTVGGCVLSILSDVVYNSTMNSKLPEAIRNVTDPQLAQDLANVDLDMLRASTTILEQLTPEARHFVRVQMMVGIKNVFYMALGTSCLAFIAALFTTNKRVPQREEVTYDSNKEKAEEAIMNPHEVFGEQKEELANKLHPENSKTSNLPSDSSSH